MTLCVLLALGGCGGAGESGTSDTGGDAAGAPGGQVAGVPAALVGSWSGGSSDGFRSSVYTFNGDSSYSMDIRGTRITGRFSVSGNQLTTYPDGRAPLTYQWGIGQNGYLYLNGESYVPFN
ncbi:hypothetical protein [Streptomyces sp. NBC_01451]|uniref:hypothetical protein n=1 Tax=Streptomyces sp. NBC_01451 TaxID=2903872 RepID=UPI002E307463|nr:hypothetical protein [Streptomyces sp. NBC_01451]